MPLTKKQTALLIEFYETIACDDSLFPQNPVGQRAMRDGTMRLLGFDKPKSMTYRFGSVPNTDVSKEFADLKEWANAADQDSDTSKADSGSSSEGASVRTSVLSEDVQ